MLVILLTDLKSSFFSKNIFMKFLEFIIQFKVACDARDILFVEYKDDASS